MVNWVSKIFYGLVHTNLLIALAAVAQCALTYVILDFPVNGAILGIEGGSTILLYNLSLYLSKPKNPQQSPYVRTRWVFSHMSVFWSISSFGFILCCWSLFHISFYTLGYLLIIGVLSIAYAVPLFKIAGHRIQLRKVPGLKVFFIALLWSLSSVGLPVIELWSSGAEMDWFKANYLGLVKIVFLLLCTLPFDIRDEKQDRLYHLKTIPTCLGFKRSVQLSYAIGCIHLLLIYFSPYSWPIKLGMISCSCIILLLFRTLIFKQDKHYHHVYLLDVALILQWLLVLITLQIS
ncbi:hypothetical protein ACFRAE_07710 [Sphingobacterium sp. HJSM2_6]|uniref:hypothetical protein n=1 Tax=Sphingobacterium sp. HJSM2_6 TaxID=3366264 RepID=UPI003BE12B3C